tara:strand:- start:3237 stop:3860 length:624 start_codon:yes stop_codon:yes gene_type:complete
MFSDYSIATDVKMRYGGILENPYLSKVHRHCLDGFKVMNLSGILKDYTFKNILDIGCGLGEYSTMSNSRYIGLDNSFPRVHFAQRWYNNCQFMQADATQFPFGDCTFEAVLLANTIHHLSNEQLTKIILEMKRVSSRYLIIDDCVKFKGQNRLSQYFYSLDRGTMFRTAEQIEEEIMRLEIFEIKLRATHRTFPGLYEHVVFLVEKK